MTATELANLIDWIQDRWPNVSALRNWEAVAIDFAGIPSAAVREAAENHYKAGNRTAPTFAELRSEGAKIAGNRGMTDPQANNCDVRNSHSRNWAVVEIEGGKREAQCLDCGSIIIRPAHQLRTVGEVEDGQTAGPAGPASTGYDTLTERIAP